MIFHPLSYKFELASVGVFEPEELAATKVRLTSFLLEIAHQMQARLPDNMRILKKINVFGGSNLTDVGEVAAHYQTLGDTGIDVTAVESEWWRLCHTSLESTGNTPCPILG